jgi:pilus assembly protein Flp/PilA
MTMKNSMIGRFLRDESGATAIEYGLIAALIAIVIILSLIAIGADISNIFTNAANGFKG